MAMLRDDIERAFGEWLKSSPTGLAALTEGQQPVDAETMARALALRDVMLYAADEIERLTL